MLSQPYSARWGSTVRPKYHWPPVERARDAGEEGGGERRGRGRKKGKLLEEHPGLAATSKAPLPQDIKQL